MKSSLFILCAILLCTGCTGRPWPCKWAGEGEPGDRCNIFCKCKHPNFCIYTGSNMLYDLKCKAPAELYESCSFINQCKEGLSCQPVTHKCYHSPRKLGEPCGPFNECADGLQCRQSPTALKVNTCETKIIPDNLVSRVGCNAAKSKYGCETCNGEWEFCSLSLIDMVFPGSHNAGAYQFNLPNIPYLGVFGATQYQTPIKKQLEEGIRYLDLDFCDNGALEGDILGFQKHIRVGHKMTKDGYNYMCGGDTMEVVFTQVKTWLQNNPREVIILAMSNGAGDFAGGELSLVSSIVEILGSHNIVSGAASLEITLGEIIRGDYGGRVVILSNSRTVVRDSGHVTALKTSTYTPSVKHNQPKQNGLMLPYLLENMKDACDKAKNTKGSNATHLAHLEYGYPGVTNIEAIAQLTNDIGGILQAFENCDIALSAINVDLSREKDWAVVKASRLLALKKFYSKFCVPVPNTPLWILPFIRLYCTTRCDHSKYCRIIY